MVRRTTGTMILTLSAGLALAGIAYRFGKVGHREKEPDVSPNSSSGLVNVPSGHSVAETAQRLEASLKQKGIQVFARIDHAAGAKDVGMDLRPTLLLIFGNAKAGTPLMQSKQTVAIDLPLKALIWEDADGKVWLTYNRPDYVAERHGIADRTEAVKTLSVGLEALAKTATE